MGLMGIDPVVGALSFPDTEHTTGRTFTLPARRYTAIPRGGQALLPSSAYAFLPMPLGSGLPYSICCMADTRSYARITWQDLKRLIRLAQEEREDFFARHPEWAILYRKSILCTALGGDGALHYLNGITGVDEFQVLTFYAENSEAPFPPQHVSHLDYGKSKFGRSASLPASYEGLRVELRGRSLQAKPGDDPLEALQHYLKARASPTARELAGKAVVLLEPEEFFGVEAWPSLVLPPRR